MVHFARCAFLRAVFDAVFDTEHNYCSVFMWRLHRRRRRRRRRRCPRRRHLANVSLIDHNDGAKRRGRINGVVARALRAKSASPPRHARFIVSRLASRVSNAVQRVRFRRRAIVTGERRDVGIVADVDVASRGIAVVNIDLGEVARRNGRTRNRSCTTE